MFPPGTWDKMAAHLANLSRDVGVQPRALLVVSAHWEADVPTVYSPPVTSLLYDYYGFPPSAYQLQYPAPGDPKLASEIRGLLANHGLPSAEDSQRGFDHGVFIPLKLAYPKADVPIVQLSLRSGLDPEAHFAIGRALAPLRERGVLIVGSGMSYHNLRALGAPAANADALAFDQWLEAAVSASSAVARNGALARWASAPGARVAHPREEHLAPLFVAAGAAGDDVGSRNYEDAIFGKAVSGFVFGG
jgi:aromatic ring-opening dioxygenase catalytic subunit (LigB family)